MSSVVAAADAGAAAATALRWRSRVQKVVSEDSVEQDNTSVPLGEAEDASSSTKNNRKDYADLCFGFHIKAWDVVAAIAVGSAVGALLSSISWVITLSASTTMILAVYALSYIPRRLKQLGTIRDNHNLLRREVNALYNENKHLSQSVTHFEASMDEMGHVQQELQQIAGGSMANVQHLMKIVKEHNQLQTQIKAKLKAQVMQQIMSVIVQSDRDQNFSLNPREVETLILRLRSIEGIEFSEVTFRGIMAADPDRSLRTIMKIIRNLDEDDEEKDDHIFQMKPRQLLQFQ